ncbi:MAG: NAD-dependent epimerase/dehydratase family protein [Mariprofundus sp.]|nr:NAD-dependent epimerase/dehydratase family protein [Mariprofundus sp.]
MKIKRILILGCGYVGQKLAKACMADGMQVIASSRNAEHAKALELQGIEAHVTASPLDLPDALLLSVDAVLDSIPLNRNEQGMHASQLQWLPELATRLSNVQWAAYLSTTGVYGDAEGAWVNESWPCQATSARGTERLLAEKAWLDTALPAEIFRLAGIYGPERNMIERLKAGVYQTVAWNPPHYSSRIHIDDIVAALLAAMQQAQAGRIMNLADDLPLPHAEYVCALAEIIGAPAPEILTEQQGELQLSPTALDFFRDNKRVSNALLHEQLLPQLKFPDFKHGIADIIK